MDSSFCESNDFYEKTEECNQKIIGIIRLITAYIF